ncbi:MAG: hypothetical protein H6831_08415 [Planctomycetes bacterium]|nr:hypothetical protein [Planctomycetota bacterium]MCB9904416.1 hypothetical protein [Planctomycetota bacterium]
MSSGTVRSRLLGLAPVLGVLLFFVVTGLRGLDFGRHWDEDIQRRAVMRAVTRDTLLPGFYKYPSVSFALSVAAATPEIVARTHATDEGLSTVLQTDTDAVVKHVQSEAYKLRARTLFLLASALSVLWIALAARASGTTWLGALFAASLLGGSWELAYHARWIAPDTVMVQFTALCLAALLAARSSPRTAAFCCVAALAAGLAAGTKYPGGLLLLAVLPASVHCAAREGRSLVRAGVGSLLLFALAYLASTPGTLLEPRLFLNDLAYEAAHYAKGHWGFTVEPGIDHLSRAIRYLGVELFSDYAPLAVFTSLLALVGAVHAWRESKPLFALLVLLPLVYLLFVGTKRVLFVRNLLFLAPFMALLATRGAGLIARSLPYRAAVAFSVLLALGWTANAWTLMQAADEIRERGPAELGRSLADHLDRHPDRRYHLTKGALRCLAEAGLEAPENARFPETEANAIACLPDDLRGHLMWPANVPDRLLAAIGPRSVNYGWYTTWDEPWIAVVEPDFADWVRDVRWHAEEPTPGSNAAQH